MYLALSLLLWVAVSAAVHRALSRNGYAASPTLAGLMALALGSAGVVQLFQAPPVPQNGAFADTYYVVSFGYFLMNMAIFYLAASALAWAIWKLARGWIRRLLTPAFWMFHLGMAGVVLATVLARYQVPKRYVDYPDSFYWINMMSSYGAMLGFLGLTCLTVLTVVALIQRFFLGRKS